MIEPKYQIACTSATHSFICLSTKSEVHDNVPHLTALQRYKTNTKQFIRGLMLMNRGFSLFNNSEKKYEY